MKIYQQAKLGICRAKVISDHQEVPEGWYTSSAEALEADVVAAAPQPEPEPVYQPEPEPEMELSDEAVAE